MSNDEEKLDAYRRNFLKLAGLAAGAVAFGGLARNFVNPESLQINPPWPTSASASVQVVQTPLPGKNIPKYVEALPTFVGTRINAVAHPALTIDNLEFQQQILPASFYNVLPAPFNAGAYVYGYQISDTNTSDILGPMLYPAFTIEATKGTPLSVTYVNSLPETGSKVQQYITVDQTIHWADPLMQMGSLLPYTGPPPVVTHLHGGEVHSASDGGPDAWFTPGYGIIGPAWTYGPVTQNYTYPNEQEATTLFYHDHVLGATRLNLYAGLVGFYFIRDSFDTGVAGTGLNLPAGPQEVELAIQDKMFDTNGQLLFPDGHLVGIPPNPTIHPYWIPEFFGDAIVVNGKTWPFMNVEPRRYRFRIVDGANARFFNLSLGSKLPFWVIGTDGGLLDKPAMMSSLLLSPGERADVIVDFAPVAGKTIIMTNNAKAPFPNGATADPNTVGQIMKFIVGTTVTGGTDNSFNPAALNATLRGGGASQPPLIVRLSSGLGALGTGVTLSKKRMLTLKEILGLGGPLEVLVNNTRWVGLRADGNVIPDFTQLGPNYLSELPQIGSTEQWDIINLTMDAHPIHLHLVQFQLINRQNFNQSGYNKAYNAAFPGGAFIPEYGPPLPYNTPNASGYIGGNPDVTPFLQGKIMPPNPDEVGWKDTFKMFPGQVTRIVVRWAPQDVAINAVSAGTNKYSFDPTTGPGYVWHCHIVDHEDNEMMRPYTVAP